MPDDSKRRVTGFKYCWQAHDFLLVFGDYKQDALIRMALVLSEETGRSFDGEFFRLVGAAHRQLTETQNFDLF